MTFEEAIAIVKPLNDQIARTHASKEAIAEVRRAIEDGNEDCVGLQRLIPQPPICEAIAPARLYSEEHRCPHAARFKTRDGKQFCQIHAEQWAALEGSK